MNCQRRIVIGMLMDDDEGYCIWKWGLHAPASIWLVTFECFFRQQLYQILHSVFKKTFALRGSFPFLVVFFASIAHEKNLLEICVSNPTSLPKKQNENSWVIHIVLVIAVAFFWLSIQRRLAEFALSLTIKLKEAVAESQEIDVPNLATLTNGNHASRNSLI